MAENKKSFLLYTDLISTVSKLTDQKAGKLFKTILQYVNDMNPEVEDLLLQVAFEPIKQQLKRDLKDWEAERSKRSKAGHLGGVKSGESRRSRSKRSSASKNEANEADNVTVTVTDNVNDTVIGNTGEVFYDAEDLISKNKLQLERICMAAGKTGPAKDSLRKFHLHLEANAKYPQTKKQIFAGFEKWLMNEKKFSGDTDTKKMVH